MTGGGLEIALEYYLLILSVSRSVVLVGRYDAGALAWCDLVFRDWGDWELGDGCGTCVWGCNICVTLGRLEMERWDDF